MKRDTSNQSIIDLDSHFKTIKPSKIATEIKTYSKPLNVDYDEILSEWCYRLPKGYPTMVDGRFANRKELKILQEILQENGITEMPDFANIAPVKVQKVKQTLIKEEAGFSKEELIKIIKTTDLSDRDLVRITRIVDSLSSEDGILDLLASQKNFDKTSSMQIFRMATESGDYRQLLELLNDTAKQVDVDSLPQTGNIIDMIKDSGVSREFAKEMSNMVPYTSVKMGRYEMFLRLFLRGGQSPSVKGDVEVDGKEMEVKSTISKGSGFRLRGNSGYGNGKQVQTSFMKQLIELYGVGGPNHGGSQNIPKPILEAYKQQNGQMWYGTKDSWAVLANRDMIESGLATKEDIIEMWGKALSELYPNTTPESVGKFIGPAFGSDGSVDMKSVASRLAAYEFTIYRMKEGFDYFIALNYQDNYGFISPELTGEGLVKLFANEFKVVSLPNTKNNSTPQDSMCAIELA